MRKVPLFSFIMGMMNFHKLKLKLVCGHSFLYMVLNDDDKNIKLFIAEGDSWAYAQKK